jgi:hypothetical protein
MSWTAIVLFCSSLAARCDSDSALATVVVPGINTKLAADCRTEALNFANNLRGNVDAFRNTNVNLSCTSSRVTLTTEDTAGPTQLLVPGPPQAPSSTEMEPQLRGRFDPSPPAQRSLSPDAPQ